MSNHSSKNNYRNTRQRALAEPLEPRVLYSADGLSLFLPVLGERLDDAEPLGSQDVLLELADALRTADSDTTSNSIVFVDSRVADIDIIVNKLRENGLEVLTIAADEDGLLVISQTLADQTELAALHVISHGSDAELALGNTLLNSETLSRNTTGIANWGQALSAEADILLYGCNLASSESGQAFVQALADTTGADVAASVDFTGHAKVGGDWDLEFRAGSVETTQEIADLFADDWLNGLATVNVTTLADVYDAPDLSSIALLLADPGADGQISLREALTAANNTAGADIINLPVGTHQLTRIFGPGDTNLAGDLDVLDDVSLVGAGSNSTVIEMTTISRVVDVHSATVALSGLTITGGQSLGDGAGLHVRPGSDVTLTDVVVDSNTTLVGGDGAGIYNDQANLTLINSSVTNNTARNNGGGISSVGASSSLTLINSIIDSNHSTSKSGGGIYNEGTLTLLDTNVSNNDANQRGGGIANVGVSASLTATRALIDNNDSVTRDGGGIHNEGVMTLLDVIVSNNHAKDHGGGISNQGQADLERVTINNNVADKKGGGINHHTGSATMSLLNVTVSGNQADEGGGLRIDRDISIANSTIVNNTSDKKAGGLWVQGGAQATLANTILANNTVISSGSHNASGNVISLGFNLFSNAPAVGALPTDILNTDPNLNPLTTGIGFVPTHAPMINSAAINAGSTVSHTTDARGEDLNEIADIGAHEYDGAAGVVYWTDGVDTVYRIDAAFGVEQTLLDSRSQPTDIEVDLQHGRIYWLEIGISELYSAKLDGSDVRTELTGLTNATGIALNAAAGQVYVAYSTGFSGSISRYNLSGPASPVQIVSGLINPRDVEIDVDAGRLYWTDAGTGAGDASIKSTDLGGGVVALHVGASNLGGPAGLAVDPGTQKLYWAAPGADQLWSINALNSSDIGAENTTVVDPTGVTYDTINGRLIWTSTTADRIVTTDVTLATASETELLVTSNPSGIAYGATTSTDLAPVITLNNGGSLSEGGSYTLVPADLAVSDADTTSDLINFGVTDAVDNGRLELTSTPGVAIAGFTLQQFELGQVIYVHNGGETATDSFNFTVDDGTTTLNATEFVFNITPVNDNTPSALADTINLNEGATSTVLASGDTSVLANDTDPDLPNDTLTIQSSTAASHGALTVNPDGTFSYTHDGSENYTDAFTYTVVDGAGNTNTATVEINITPVNDNSPSALADTINLNEGAISTVLASGDTSVLANDTDPDLPNDTLTIQSSTAASHGALTVNPDGTFSYSHDGSENYTDAFTYTVVDGAGNTNTATVEINITPVNDNSPSALADTINLNEGAISTVLASGDTSVLANDTDPDLPNDTLTIQSSTAASHGALTVNPDGTFSYSHDGSENYTDAFTYTVVDGAGNTNTATVEINITPVNDNSPSALADTINLNEGAISTVLASGDTSVLANDTDPDLPNDTLTIQSSTAASHGALTVNPDGTFSYSHDGSENYTDAFTYTVVDGAGNTNTATVEINITPVNDNSPSALADTINLNEGATSTVLASGDTSVLANDTDPDLPNDTLTIQSSTAASHGALTVNPDGTFSYSHNGSENYTDAFTYTVVDGAGNTNTATVEINITPVNDNTPSALADTINLNEGATSTVLASGETSVLANDTDPDLPNDTLTIQSSTAASHGALTVNPDGTFSYSHNGSENYTDAFTYTVVDVAGNTNTATVEINITPVNDNSPSALADTINLNEGATSTVLASGDTSVLANDIDADLPLDSLTVSLSQPVQHGELQISVDGTFIYTHDASENLRDSFGYTVTDADGNISNEVLVDIVITNVNDAPQLQQALGSQSATEGEPFMLIIAPAIYVDTDADEQLLIRLQMANGELLPEWLSFNPETNTLSGTPGNSDVGTIVLYVDAVDRQNALGQGFLFSLVVENINAAPSSITLDANEITENVSGVRVGQLSATDADAGDTLQFSINDSRFIVTEGVIYLKPDQQINYEAEAEITLIVTATDAAQESITQSFTLSVIDANDDPELVVTPAPKTISTTVNYAVPADTFIDEDRDSLAYTAVQINGEDLPAWLNFNSISREFSLLEPGQASEELRVIVIAEDNRGGRAEVEMTLQFAPILAAAEPPVEAVTENTDNSAAVELTDTPIVEPRPINIAVTIESETDETESATSEIESTATPEIDIATFELSELINPLPKYETLTLGGISDALPSPASLEARRDLTNAIDTFDLSELLGFQDHSSARAFSEITDAFNQQNDASQNATEFAHTVVGTSATFASGLTVGYLVWLIRGGTLMGSVLSSMPAWRLVDPLPILASLEGGIDDDHESLETMVDADSSPDKRKSDEAVDKDSQWKS